MTAVHVTTEEILELADDLAEALSPGGPEVFDRVRAAGTCWCDKYNASRDGRNLKEK